MDRIWWNPFTWWNKDVPQAANQNLKVVSDTGKIPGILKDTYDISNNGTLDPSKFITRGRELEGSLLQKSSQIQTFLASARANSDTETYNAVLAKLEPEKTRIENTLSKIRESNVQYVKTTLDPLWKATSGELKFSLA